MGLNSLKINQDTAKNVKRKILKSSNFLTKTVIFLRKLLFIMLIHFYLSILYRKKAPFLFIYRPVMSGPGLYDPTSIMNADTLNKCQREGWIKLAFYLLSFFYYLYG